MNSDTNSTAFREPMIIVIFIEGLLPLLIIILVAVNNRGPRRGVYLSIYALVIPIYWILMSAAAISAIFMRRVEWYKTKRAIETHKTS